MTRSPDMPEPVLEPRSGYPHNDSEGAASHRTPTSYEPRRCRVAFVHNFCSHYTLRTFELLSRLFHVDFYFFSRGTERYWLKEHGVQRGRFNHNYLSGFSILGTRISPTLPYYLISGRYDVVVASISGRFALPITYLVARLLRRPFILYTGIWHHISSPTHSLFRPFLRFLYRHADAIVTYGIHVARFLENEGAVPSRLFIAPHAVDNNAYNRAVAPGEIRSLRERLHIPRTHKILLYLGRLDEAKGVDILLEAFAALERQDTTLLIVGAGPARDKLETLARSFALTPHVRFAGYVRTNETVVYYAAAYVYILPSVTTRMSKETWGLTVNEAMNQGTPVVVSDAVGAAA